jgi:tripartite-type tricarboxylate transporter receptor subunit TctC
LVGVVLAKESGVTMTHVPYKGAGPAINDLLGHQVDVLITSTSSVAGMIQGGQVRTGRHQSASGWCFRQGAHAGGAGL